MRKSLNGGKGTLSSVKETSEPKNTKTEEGEIKTNFPEPEKKDEVEVLDKDGNPIKVDKETPLTPAEYFEKVKSKITEETSENIKAIYNVTINKLKKYMITGQKAAAKELYAKCLYLEKEQKLIDKGVCKYVLRTDIDKYINDVADECVCVIEMKNFDRPIPDELVDIVAETMDIFNEFYIIFTDYTGEKRSKVAKERRDKDPILFGNIFIDGKVSPKMFYIGSWIDDYCDLTLDKMIESLAKDAKKNKEEFVYDINDTTTIEEIEKQLFGETKSVNKSTMNTINLY